MDMSSEVFAAPAFVMAGHMFASEVHVGSKRRAEEVSSLEDDISLLDVGALNNVVCAVEMGDFDWSSDDVETSTTYNFRYSRPRLSDALSDPDSIEEERTEAQDSSNFLVFSEDVLKFASNAQLKFASNAFSSPSGFVLQSPSGFLSMSAPPSPSLMSRDSTAANTPAEKPNRSVPTTSSSKLGSQTAVDASKAFNKEAALYDKEAALYDKEARLADKEARLADTEAAELAESTRRGVNVRRNPQMQKTARDGQKHWHDKVQEMRLHYDMARTGMVHPQFAEQRFMCTVRNLKCQKESLLIFLQFAMQQRIISPLAFVHPGDENASFLGWTGFLIHPGCGAHFRAGIEALFPEPPKLNTLYHLFRRSGLVPEDWRRAWDGEIPFLWNPARESK